MENKHLEYLERIAKSTYEIGKTYQQLYELELNDKVNEPIYKELILILKEQRDLLNQMYSEISSLEEIDDMIAYILSNKFYLYDLYFLQFMKESYVKYQILSFDEGLNCGLKDPLLFGILFKLDILKGKATLDSLEYKKMLFFSSENSKRILWLLDKMLKTSSINKKKYLLFAKTFLTITDKNFEDIVLESVMSIDEKEMRDEFQKIFGDEDQEKLFSTVMNEVDILFNHLVTITDEMYEDFNTNLMTMLYSIYLRSCLMFLTHEQKEKLEEDTLNMSKWNVKSRRLIKNAMDSYDEDCRQYFG